MTALPLATLGVLLDRALERLSGEACVEWAISLLLEGRDGRFLRRLAGMTPPFNHFEMADLRDRALAEQGLGAAPPPENVAHAYVAARLESVLSSGPDAIGAVLDEAANLYHALDLDSGLQDLAFLAFARDDFRTGERVSFHWQAATPETLDGIVREKAIEFVLLHRDAIG